jgi:hypothetical protein
MSDTLTITPSLDHFQVNIPIDAQLARKNAIELAQSVTQVTNETELADAIAAASMCRGLEKQCEDARKVIKEPVLEAGKRIDTIAKGFAGGLSLERQRLEKACAEYHAAKQARIEAETARELLDMAASTDMSEDAMRSRASRLAEISQPVKVEGAQVRSGLDYDILDITALAAARPDLVTITPKRREILAYINIPNMPALPGVRTFSQTILHAKAS